MNWLAFVAPFLLTFGMPNEGPVLLTESIDLPMEEEGGAQYVLLNSEGTKAAVSYRTGMVRVFLLDARTVLGETRLKAGLTPVGFHPDSRSLFLADNQANFYQWDPQRPEASLKLVPSSAVAFLENPKYRLAIQGRTARIERSDGGPGRPLATHTSTILSQAFSPDGRWLATGEYSGITRVWDADTGCLQAANGSGQNFVKSLSFNSGGTLLVVTGEDAVRVLRTSTGEEVAKAARVRGTLEHARLDRQSRIVAVSREPGWRIRRGPITALAVDSSAPRPKLLTIAVGINRYEKIPRELRYAENDAEGIVAALAATQGRLKFAPEAVKLRGNCATRDNILASVARASGASTANDVCLLFMAGHGLAVGGEFFFYPYDLSSEEPASITAQGISAHQLTESFAGGTAGRLIFIVDACRSGAAMQSLAASIEKWRGRSNRTAHVLLSAAPNENAMEIEALHHGVLSYGLIETLAELVQGTDSVSLGRVLQQSREKAFLTSQKHDRRGLQRPLYMPFGADFPWFAGGGR